LLLSHAGLEPVLVDLFITRGRRRLLTANSVVIAKIVGLAGHRILAVFLAHILRE
jgi:hypothetical protein